MKGQTAVWLAEYIERCKCPDWRPPRNGIHDLHVHAMPYRHKRDSQGQKGPWFPVCVCWAQEMQLVWDFFLERGCRYGVVFVNDCITKPREFWGKIEPAIDGGWEQYATPTLRESLSLCVTENMELVAEAIVRIQLFDPGRFDRHGAKMEWDHPRTDSRSRDPYLEPVAYSTELLFEEVGAELGLKKRELHSRFYLLEAI